MDFRKQPSWKAAKRLLLDPGRRAAVNLLHRNDLPLMWCRGTNWGDALSPVLAGLLSEKKVYHVHGIHHDRYLCIGSILGSANERSTVWGSGFIRESETVIGVPRAVCAVRGPLSRASLLRQGIDCPEIYGDPALLLPNFYNPPITKRYAIGIIPHYVDKTNVWLDKYRQDPNVRILDIEDGIQEFVNSIKSCETVVSSSLHGLICADAYQIPNAWVQFSDDVVGGDFKFRDYRLSIGEDEPHPIRMTSDRTLQEVVKSAAQHSIRLDLRQLLLSCPFLSDRLRSQWQDERPQKTSIRPQLEVRRPV